MCWGPSHLPFAKKKECGGGLPTSPLQKKDCGALPQKNRQGWASAVPLKKINLQKRNVLGGPPTSLCKKRIVVGGPSHLLFAKKGLWWGTSHRNPQITYEIWTRFIFIVLKVVYKVYKKPDKLLGDHLVHKTNFFYQLLEDPLIFFLSFSSF